MIKQSEVRRSFIRNIITTKIFLRMHSGLRMYTGTGVYSYLPEGWFAPVEGLSF